ncbi:hypothetical protein E8M01_18170 [Phreatobacter stygius]|uniref:Uncharacterized protein n=1 Tax=Phreatobacter stygius TaxID=1940610 RepID=A0A4D7B8S0_9HYPH|nr:hypothetical protein E8M01_18170 [Phreatobacter stygius]
MRADWPLASGSTEFFAGADLVMKVFVRPGGIPVDSTVLDSLVSRNFGTGRSSFVPGRRSRPARRTEPCTSSSPSFRCSTRTAPSASTPGISAARSPPTRPWAQTGGAGSSSSFRAPKPPCTSSSVPTTNPPPIR